MRLKRLEKCLTDAIGAFQKPLRVFAPLFWPRAPYRSSDLHQIQTGNECKKHWRTAHCDILLEYQKMVSIQKMYLYILLQFDI